MTNNSPDNSVRALVVRPREARRMYGDCSMDEIYEKIKTGEIASYLDGRRRLILVSSIEADIARRAQAAAATGFQAHRYPAYDPKKKRRPSPRKRATPDAA